MQMIYSFIAFLLCLTSSVSIANPNADPILRIRVSTAHYDGLFSNEHRMGVTATLYNPSDDYIVYRSNRLEKIAIQDITLFIQDSGGKIRSCKPWQYRDAYRKSEPEFRLLNTGKHVYESLNLFVSTQHMHWEWWNQVGFRPGEHKVWLTYCSTSQDGDSTSNEHFWSGCVQSDTAEFTIDSGDFYVSHPEHNSIQLLEKDENNFPKRLGYFNTKGQLVAERYFKQRDYYPIHPNMEVIYDKPVSGPHWQWQDSVLYVGKYDYRMLSWYALDSTGSKLNGKITVFEPQQWNSRKSYDCNVQNGQLDGAFQDGRNRVTGYFDIGVPDRVWRDQYDTTLFFECNYKNGVLHGNFVRKKYYGHITLQTNYKNGALHGDYLEYWHESKVIRYRRKYEDGVRVGTWSWHRQDGSVLAQGSYQNGKPWNGSFMPEEIRTTAGGRSYIVIHHYKDGVKVENPDK